MKFYMCNKCLCVHLFPNDDFTDKGYCLSEKEKYEAMTFPKYRSFTTGQNYFHNFKCLEDYLYRGEKRDEI